MNHSKKSESGKRKIYDLSNFHVLLVEDYEFMQQLITGMLKAFGVGHISVCNNGREAKNLISFVQTSKSSTKPKIDIVLTDWLMPEMSGPEMIEWIRSHNHDMVKFLPIIMISAYASEDVVTKGRDIGANEALVKPVSGEKLAARILSVINHPRPFVKAPGFFGPDRRRKKQFFDGEEKRKMNSEDIQVHHE